MTRKSGRGFTLVELVIVIAVIAVLAAVLIPTFSGIVNNAKKSKDLANARTVNTNLLVYKAEEGVDKIDVHAAYLWTISNGLSLTSTAKGYSYWFNEDTEAFELLKTEDVIGPEDGGDVAALEEGWLAEELTLEADLGAGGDFDGNRISLVSDVSSYSLDPGRLSASRPELILLDERTDDEIVSAINGIRHLVRDAKATGASSEEAIKSKMSELYDGYMAELPEQVRDVLEPYAPNNTIYISESGVYGGTGATSTYCFELGLTQVGNEATSLSATLNDVNMVIPVTVGLLMPGSLSRIGGTNFTVTVQNPNIYILPGSLSTEVLNNSGLAVTVPEGMDAYKLQKDYTQKEAVYTDGHTTKTVRVNGTGLNGNLADYFPAEKDRTGLTLLREYLIPSISFASADGTSELQGVKRIELKSAMYGNYIQYYGVAYNKNGGVLAVTSDVGYMTDATVGAINQNADGEEVNGNWKIDVSNPEKLFTIDERGISVEVTYSTYRDGTAVAANRKVTLSQDALTGDYYSTGNILVDGSVAYSEIVITHLTIRDSGRDVIFQKIGSVEDPIARNMIGTRPES